MTRIDVDFNELGRGGLVRVRQRRADGDVAVGDKVELWDSSDPDMKFSAVIESMEPDGSRGWARVNWADPAFSHPEFDCVTTTLESATYGSGHLPLVVHPSTAPATVTFAGGALTR